MLLWPSLFCVVMGGGSGVNPVFCCMSYVTCPTLFKFILKDRFDLVAQLLLLMLLLLSLLLLLLLLLLMLLLCCMLQ